MELGKGARPGTAGTGRRNGARRLAMTQGEYGGVRGSAKAPVQLWTGAFRAPFGGAPPPRWLRPCR
ncbi:hypothetical protein SRO_5360 [Streptomyces rochei]|nr:hypothetical protein SRO_5360 [Streptomyces rochei]